MKKFLLLTACAVAFAAPAHAEFYGGIDVQENVVSYQNKNLGGGLAVDPDLIAEDSFTGLNIHVGNRLHKNYGVELGAFKTKGESKFTPSGATIGPATLAATNITTDVSFWGLTLDGMGYLPVSEQVELVGSAGVTWTDMEQDIVGLALNDESEFGFRVGAGAQFNINDRWNVRGMARYQTADFDGIADNLMTYSLGVNYSF